MGHRMRAVERAFEVDARQATRPIRHVCSVGLDGFARRAQDGAAELGLELQPRLPATDGVLPGANAWIIRGAPAGPDRLGEPDKHLRHRWRRFATVAPRLERELEIRRKKTIGGLKSRWRLIRVVNGVPDLDREVLRQRSDEVA